MVKADRKMLQYRSFRPPDTALRERRQELATERRRFGYRRLFVLLRREGEVSGKTAGLVAGSCRRLAVHCAGKPTQNGFVESFNGRMRDELLNESLFFDLSHARVKLATWTDDYNNSRPHSRSATLPLRPMPRA